MLPKDEVVRSLVRCWNIVEVERAAAKSCTTAGSETSHEQMEYSERRWTGDGITWQDDRSVTEVLQTLVGDAPVMQVSDIVRQNAGNQDVYRLGTEDKSGAVGEALCCECHTGECREWKGV